jgi:cysteine desulfuration protein SufE
VTAAALPPKLAETVELLALLPGRDDRIQALIDVAERFRDVPERVARRPFPAETKVPACESEAYVWAEPLADGALRFHFAVENPQGISAKALAVILDETLSGAAPAEVAAVPVDVVYRIFGSELSMGKSMGLTSMVAMVKEAARRAGLQELPARESTGSRPPVAGGSGGPGPAS